MIKNGKTKQNKTKQTKKKTQNKTKQNKTKQKQQQQKKTNSGHHSLKFDHLGTVHKHSRGVMQKNFIVKNFRAPPFTPQKISAPPGPLCAMKITGEPHRKACKLNFYW